ncbi:SDR family NAD(P)-dependent oxidoreductase [Paenarthrobacter aurescens]|uniref:SDR family NAD(P)-dependent oxidoreductase n=1 Tax=Paenarthrobacter aurescens TaxID=43663 RepID=UPI0035EE8D06
MDRPYSGQTYIITGAGNGLGFEYAKTLTAKGAHVVINDLGGAPDGSGSSNAAEHAASSIVAAGGTASANTADVTDEVQVKEMIDQAFAVTGKLDGLICNAGVIRDKMLFNMTPQDWDIVQKVHLRGHFLPLHFAAARWREQSKNQGAPVAASVVLTTSRSGLYSSAGQLNYASAKAGVASMAIVAARELEKYGVRVNAIAPMAATRMTEGSFGEINSKRWEPANVAPMSVYLASPESKGISGQVFIVGGGRVEWMKTWEPQGAMDACGELTDSFIAENVGAMFAGRDTRPAPFPTATWAD